MQSAALARAPEWFGMCNRSQLSLPGSHEARTIPSAIVSRGLNSESSPSAKAQKTLQSHSSCTLLSPSNEDGSCLLSNTLSGFCGKLAVVRRRCSGSAVRVRWRRRQRRDGAAMAGWMGPLRWGEERRFAKIAATSCWRPLRKVSGWLLRPQWPGSRPQRRAWGCHPPHARGRVGRPCRGFCSRPAPSEGLATEAIREEIGLVTQDDRQGVDGNLSPVEDAAAQAQASQAA